MLLHHRKEIRNSVAYLKDACKLKNEDIIWNVLGNSLTDVNKLAFNSSEVLKWASYDDITSLLNTMINNANKTRVWVEEAVRG